MELRSDIEYAIHCDEKGNIIGPISKDHAHLSGVRETLAHYSTWSMVYNPVDKAYGIQLKNPKKHDKYGGGKWDMGVAGHNCYIKQDNNWVPTSFSKNLIKETEEEIGLDLTVYETLESFLDSAYKVADTSIGYIFEEFLYKTDINNEWVGLGLILTTEKKLTFTDDEVIDFKWLSDEKLEQFIKNNDNYCAPLPMVFEKAQKFIKKHNI